MFTDRKEAGDQLADKLLGYKGQDVVVMAIPRGGLPLGEIIAKTLEAPLEVALSKKIGHPFNKEYAIGAVSLQSRVLSDNIDVENNYIEEETIRIRKKLEKHHNMFYTNREPSSLEGRTVIIVDDGIATGNTILATVELVGHQNPKAIIVAIPVAPSSAIRKLKHHPNVDEVVCLEVPYDFRAVGQYYQHFPQVSDTKAIKMMQQTAKEKQ